MGTKMTMREFMDRMLHAFPDAQVEEDNYRQLIIYTGLEQVPKDGVHPSDWMVVSMEEKDNASDGQNSQNVGSSQD